MLKLCWLLALLCVLPDALSQTMPLKKIQKNKFTDSAMAAQLADDMVYDLPVIAVSDQERTDQPVSFMPSLLFANRDIVVGMAAFHFNTVRFRLRGYDAAFSETKINGISMNNPDDGITQWSVWTGLNDVTRNTQSWLGLRSSELGFGNTGNTTAIDMRASKQWVQHQFSYAFSNRSFTHRWMFTGSRGLNAKGWAYSFSASWRAAKNGYMPGTGYSGGSYFLGVDKRINTQHLLSLLIFGSSSVSGRQGAILQESASLASTHFYNPFWGYQSGSIRNANIARAHLPVLIITHDYQLNNNSTWITSLGGTFGKKTNTALDWFNAPDPRPDYYRYLPSYQTDSLVRMQVIESLSNDERLRQVNWDHLYEVNRNSLETTMNVDGILGNSRTGLRSHYLLAERVTGIKRIELTTVFNTRLNPVFSMACGAGLQLQQSCFFKKINDLLGGEYFLDRNQFAERDFPNNENVIQNDLNRPNSLLYTGDVYGYHYSVNTQRADGWLQISGSDKRTDYFAALALNYTYYQRDGYMRNGLFPDQSFGRSRPVEFTNYACKAGIVYKINGRKYVYLHAAVLTKAPLFDDVFISPRTRDTEQESIVNKKIVSLESGFVWNSPSVKLRLSGYYTHFSDGMNVMTFYHDGYRNFVNYALFGIQKLHVGIEMGMQLKLSAKLSIETVACIGRFYDNSRQQVTVTADNDAQVLERNLIYSQNFRVGSTPQEAYGLGIRYQPSGFIYCNLTANLFRQQWLEYNPLRRTYSALENIVAGSDQWNRMIKQTMLPVQSTIDFSAGSSVRTKFFGSKNSKTLLLNISINNLLDNRQIISGGYEQ
ncbi:MAG: TonB-dependent receptor, partial [Sediminibacterium sp.]|nr:TonB-dependent receptor [Sediminibacterium sp.]